MSRLERILFAGLLSAGLVVPPLARAADGKDKKPEQLSEKERKRKVKQTLKELDTPYRKWLDEEVVYIITPEERTAFLQLSNNEEREQYIEAFWQRRNPNPDLADNSFKEEHYRRIAYANERFASGIPGWKTDRGRIYIMWGPPDETETHPAGGSYSRPMEEGGGETSTYPFEKWRYRYLEGIGNDVNLEFVDTTGSGEYHLTMDPGEKDALLHVPGAGLTMLESMGMASKTDRFSRTDGMTIGKGFGETAAMNEFNRLELYAKVQRPPEVKFKDLEAVVTSRIVRNQMQFDYRYDFLRVAGDTVLVPITIQIPNRQLTFQNKEGVHTATLNIFCRITTLTGRMVQTFEDVVTRDFPDSLLEASLKLHSIYQKAVPLRAGRYRLDIVIKDVQSGNVGVVSTALPVPRYEDEKLSASSLILADQLEPVPAKQIGTGQFVLGSTKVRPKLNGEFTTDEKLGIYMQLYNLKVDETSHRPKASIQYKVSRGDHEVWGITEYSDQLKQASDQITIERQLPLSPLGPGKYKLEITAADQLNNQTISKTAEFTVKPVVEVKAAANTAPGR
ncbi:MAG TPA: GWxTD domain-containing protein [Candidatus Acidoferrales bacterium]|nr:GWxTD domain-containing protein [Candidatus Acidoferrales bacterium]